MSQVFFQAPSDDPRVDPEGRFAPGLELAQRLAAAIEAHGARVRWTDWRPGDEDFGHRLGLVDPGVPVAPEVVLGLVADDFEATPPRWCLHLIRAVIQRERLLGRTAEASSQIPPVILTAVQEALRQCAAPGTVRWEDATAPRA